MNRTEGKPLRSTALIAALAAVSLTVSACNDGDSVSQAPSSIAGQNTAEVDQTTSTASAEATQSSQSSSKDSADSESSAAAQSSVTASNELEPMAGSQPLDVLPGQGAHLKVVDVRDGGHRDFDRFVVELDGEGQPGWFVQLTEEPRGMGSGLPIEYKGAQAMVIGLRGIEAPINRDGSIRPKVEAPKVEAHTKVIDSISNEGWFEGEQRFVIGLKKRNPEFKVNLLRGPTRVVIDIMH